MKVGNVVISGKVKYSIDEDFEPLTDMRISKVQVLNDTASVIPDVSAVCLSIDGVATSADTSQKIANTATSTKSLPPNGGFYVGLFEFREDGVYLHNDTDCFPRKSVVTDGNVHTADFVVYSGNGSTVKFTATFQNPSPSVSVT